MKRVVLCGLVSFGLFASSAFSYDYKKPKLILQSSLYDGFKLPPATLFTDTTPGINDNREISVTLGLIGAEEITGIWIGDLNSGKIEYFRHDLNKISNTQINQNGNFSFVVAKEGEDVNFFQAIKKADGSGYDFNDLLTKEVFWDYTGFKNPKLINGKQFFLARNFQNNKGIYTYKGNEIVELERENNKRSKNKISFLFNPYFDESGFVTYKVRLGERRQWEEERGDQIILNQNGIKKVIASDKDYDQSSHWLGFRNSASVNKHGVVAFVGKNLNGKNQLVISDGKLEKVLVTEGVELKTISYFNPIINDSNVVAFRGISKSGKHAIFVAKDGLVKPVIQQGKTFKTPLGERMFAYGNHIPFGGNISFNNLGDLIFNTGLSSDNGQKDYGKGIVVLMVEE